MRSPYNPHFQKSRRQHLRNESTSAEQILWKHISHKQLEGKKFRRQYGIDNFIVDFYSTELRLAIEIDGDSHFESEEAEKNDKEREEYISKSHNIKFLRFTNADVMHNISGVVGTILDYIKSYPS
ncbi:MAG: endonuclease domain-containing protein [Patescibacteria group bacterium]